MQEYYICSPSSDICKKKASKNLIIIIMNAVEGGKCPKIRCFLEGGEEHL